MGKQAIRSDSLQSREQRYGPEQPVPKADRVAAALETARDGLESSRQSRPTWSGLDPGWRALPPNLATVNLPRSDQNPKYP
jgi:hypothetical protein